jgi:hypothetical protein
VLPPAIALMMEAARASETSVDNYFTRHYIPEDNSEHHTRRRENLKFLISVLSSCLSRHLLSDFLAGYRTKSLCEFR